MLLKETFPKIFIKIRPREVITTSYVIFAVFAWNNTWNISWKKQIWLVKFFISKEEPMTFHLSNVRFTFLKIDRRGSIYVRKDSVFVIVGLTVRSMGALS